MRFNPLQAGARRVRSAFTLVELLVVIGIIAVLISILLPTLGRARELARQTKCLANLRSLGQALTMYTQQNKGFFPGHAGLTAGGVAYAVWPVRLRPFVNGTRATFVCPSQPEGFDWPRVSGAGAGYASTEETRYGYEPNELLLDVFKVPFSYGYNDWGAGNPQPGPNATQRGLGGDLWTVKEVNMSRVKRPSELIVLADNVTDGVWDYNIDPADPRESPGKIHQRGCNVLYADGHAQWSAQQDVVLFNVKTNSLYGKGTPEWNRVAPLWNLDYTP